MDAQWKLLMTSVLPKAKKRFRKVGGLMLFTLKKVNFFQKTEKICTFILNYLYIYKNCCIFARYFEFNGRKTLNG